MSQAWRDLGGRRRTLARQVYREETDCWICGKWVDQELPRGDPGSRSVDHIIELQDGGPMLDRSLLRLAHWSCNSSKGIRRRWERHRQREADDLTIALDPHTL